MTLAPGSRLGPYEVTAQIGVGGMGEVYRATDTRLGRAVAIKVLPASLAQDPDRLARFDREARTLASLNHPNIAAIHGIEDAGGTKALVMELVEGPTLAERVAQRPIPIDDALPIARQIADALAAAHEQGIVHRDLKPANIKVRPDGTVKVLDFGLAKALEPGAGIGGQGSGGLASASMSPTITSPAMTQTGLILGTAAYMSPEQARGKTVDKRADIWAFGCVVYEMLTGVRTFDAEDVSLTLSVVLQREPDFAALPATVPSHVAQALRVCLRKDPKQRASDINDVRLAMDGAFTAPDDAAGVQTAAPAMHRRTLWAIAVAVPLLVAAVSTYAWWRASRPVERPLMRLSVDLGPDAVQAGRSAFSLSPDGTRIVFVGRTAEDTRQLFTRRLDEPTATPLQGTVFGPSLSMPFFSPQSDWIGFVAANTIWKVPAQGGSVLEVTKAPGLVLGASWGDDRWIVFSTGTQGGLFRVPESGGAFKSVKGERINFAPHVLPGARHVLVTTAKLANFVSLDDGRIEVVDVEDGTAKVLLDAGYDARFIPTPGGSGHLIFVQKGTLHGVAFDQSRLETRGTPVPLVTGVGNSNMITGAGHYTVSSAGTLAYLPFSQVRIQQQLVSMTASGQMTPLVAQPGSYGVPRFSPDGSRLAYIAIGPKGGDVWIHDLQRDTSDQLTFTAPGVWEVAWAPDSKHLVFADGRSLWWIRADGSGEPRRLLEVGAENPRPFSFRSDGRLAFGRLGNGGVPDIWTVPLDLSDPANPKVGKPEPFLTEPYVEVDAAFSPDGRFLAYASSETGPNEIFVRPFPAPGGKRKISTGGGKFPAWSRTGQVFFLGGDDRVMVVDYTTDGQAFLPGQPRPWAPTQVYRDGVRLPFDLAPDGKRVVVLPRPAESRTEGSLHATFLMNFFDEVRRRIP